MIDWTKPLQWNDGTKIEAIEDETFDLAGVRHVGYLVTGPMPPNWPSDDCVPPTEGVTVNEKGEILGWEHHALKVVNAPASPPTQTDHGPMAEHPLWGTFA